MARHSIAVVIVTIGRQSLLRAVRSIFAQQFSQPVQVLIGVDCDRDNNIAIYKAILAKECPSHIRLDWVDLGYSTSQRHGGIHASFYGGSLRTVLTLLADSHIVSYLDDDDWLLPDHFATVQPIFATYPDTFWAHTYCYYADSNDEKLLCIDELESVGVNAGIYQQRFGGFVRLSGLTLNVLKTLPFLHHLTGAMSSSGDGEDRLLFDSLKELPHIKINKATVACALDPHDAAHSIRMAFIQSKIGEITMAAKKESSRG